MAFLLPPAVLLLLLIGLPLAEAVLCLALRYHPRLTTSLATATLLMALLGTVGAPDIRLTLLGLTYRFDPPRRLAEGAFLLALLALLGLDRLVGRGRKFAAVCLAVAGAGAGVLLIEDGRVGAVLLLGASAATLFALVDRPLDAAPERGLGAFRIGPRPGDAESDLPGVPALDAALKYLTLMVLAAVALGIAFVLLDRYRLAPEQEPLLRLALGFLVVGLGLRLGAAPLHAWVGDLTAAPPPAAAGLALVALNGVTVFYAAQVLADAPTLLLANPLGRDLLLAGATAGVFLAALLAWSPAAQTDVRRLVAAVAVGQAGFILFGLATPSLAGFCGALLGAVAGGAGLLAALGAAGLLAARHGSADPAALVGRAQGSALALGLGLLGALGLPPLGAFAGRLLVFQAAMTRDSGWPWVAALAGGLALLLAAVFRALAPLWRMRAAPSGPALAPAPWAGLWLALLLGVGLALGLYPAPLLAVAHAWAVTIPYITGP